jgi:hypothetical protein
MADHRNNRYRCERELINLCTAQQEDNQTGAAHKTVLQAVPVSTIQELTG